MNGKGCLSWGKDRRRGHIGHGLSSCPVSWGFPSLHALCVPPASLSPSVSLAGNHRYHFTWDCPEGRWNILFYQREGKAENPSPGHTQKGAGTFFLQDATLPECGTPSTPVNVRAAGVGQINSSAANAELGFPFLLLLRLLLPLLLALCCLCFGRALFIQIFHTQILTFSSAPEASAPKDMGLPVNSGILIFYCKSHPSVH